MMRFEIAPKDEELFSRLAREILSATERFQEDGQFEESLPSSADLSRTLNIKLETVKKKLRVLKDQGLIHPVSVSPKRYRFDTWALRELDEAHPFFTLFCEPESPYHLTL
jgi:DNA-binding transcriptional MocR family regulator